MVAPAALLLTSVSERVALHAVAYDAAGLKLEMPLTRESSRTAAVTVDGEGN